MKIGQELRPLVCKMDIQTHRQTNKQTNKSRSVKVTVTQGGKLNWVTEIKCTETREIGTMVLVRGTLHQWHSRVPTNDATSSHRLHSIEREHETLYGIFIETKRAYRLYERYYNIHFKLVFYDCKSSSAKVDKKRCS